MLFYALTKPYPFYSSPKSKWLIIALFGIFISLFLIVFTPFGLAEVNNQRFNLIAFGYGLVTMLLLTFNLFIIPHLFKKAFDEDKWLVYKEIIWILYIIFTIGLGNFVFTRLVFSYPDTNFQGILSFQIITLSVAIIPVSALILISQNSLLKKNLAEASIINNKISSNKKDAEKTNEKIILLAENEKDKLVFDLGNLLFIESFGNYVKVHYLEENIEKTQVLRSSLTRIQQFLLKHKNIFQSHRAFLVNTENIIKLSGNAQGYKIRLSNVNFEIPVSRTYIKDFKNLMKQA